MKPKHIKKKKKEVQKLQEEIDYELYIAQAYPQKKKSAEDQSSIQNQLALEEE